MTPLATSNHNQHYYISFTWQTRLASHNFSHCLFHYYQNVHVLHCKGVLYVCSVNKWNSQFIMHETAKKQRCSKHHTIRRHKLSNCQRQHTVAYLSSFVQRIYNANAFNLLSTQLTFNEFARTTSLLVTSLTARWYYDEWYVWQTRKKCKTYSKQTATVTFWIVSKRSKTEQTIPY